MPLMIDRPQYNNRNNSHMW